MSKNLTKRLIIFCSILLTVLLLVACGDNNGNASNGDEAGNNSSENNSKNNSNNNDDNESDELVTISMMLNLHTPEVPNDTIPDALEEKLNVRLEDRKSTRLNSSHVASSYAVFCLKKKR